MNRRYPLAVLILCFAVLGAMPVRADTVAFGLEGSLFNGSTFQGYITINRTTGTVVSADVFLNGVGPDYDMIQSCTGCSVGNSIPGPFTGITPSGGTPVAPFAYGLWLSPTGTSGTSFPSLHLLIEGDGSLVGFNGALLCSDDNQCGPDAATNTWVGAWHSAGNTDIEEITSGHVPEPSSLILLGTGALGLFGPIRRKRLLHRK